MATFGRAPTVYFHNFFFYIIYLFLIFILTAYGALTMAAFMTPQVVSRSGSEYRSPPFRGTGTVLRGQGAIVALRLNACAIYLHQMPDLEAS